MERRNTTMNNTEKHRMFWGERPFKKGFWIASRVVFGIFAAAIFALVFGLLVMLLWNWLMPLIFGLPEITYWQAFGIVILVKLIFGALGKSGNHWHRKYDYHYEWDEHAGEEESYYGPGKWRYYRDFWKREGKKAFEDYVNRRKSQEPDDSKESEGYQESPGSQEPGGGQ
jgi:hypothetical protein